MAAWYEKSIILHYCTELIRDHRLGLCGRDAAQGAADVELERILPRRQLWARGDELGRLGTSASFHLRAFGWIYWRGPGRLQLAVRAIGFGAWKPISRERLNGEVSAT